MRLKRLELFGFKSFADKTTVLFDGGVTCVVGPNGCGKSNISDSIRWVLGERSAKMLRGSKMEDVIFNGTDVRKPLAMAEVSLTIDNSGKWLPIDYSEVTLRRRLYRSGESEYSINKTPCRRKDIQDLILDTGIGSSSYSMIEQGRIDYILSADPEKRRFLIEEAAGIAKYKVKKEEALRKLNRTEENILRLNDIIQEVHKNIQYAERQAKRAERYKIQYEKLKDLEIRKAFYDIENVDKEKDRLEGLKKECEEKISGLETQKNQSRTAQSELDGKLKGILENYSKEEAKKYELKSKMEQTRQQLQFNEEKRMGFATRKGEIQQENVQLNERIEKNKVEIASKREEHANYHKEHEEVQGLLNDSQKALQEVEESLGKLKTEFDQGKMQALETSSELTKMKNEYHRLLAFLENSKEQKTKLEQNLERFRAESAEWQQKLEANEVEVRSTQERISHLEGDQRSLSAEITQKQNVESNIQAQTKELERLIHEKQTRLEMLKGLDVSTGTDVESIRRENPTWEADLVKGIRDIVRVKEGYEWALEAALGDFARFLIVRDSEAAKTLVHHFRQKDQVAVGLFVKSLRYSAYQSFTEVFSEVQHAAVECSLREVVEIDENYREIVNPLISNTFIVRMEGPEDIPSLIDLSEKYHLVTREGVSFSQGKRIFVQQGVPMEQSIFKRGNEIAQLHTDIEKLLKDEVVSKESQIKLGQELTELTTKQEEIDAELVDCKISQESLESVRDGIQDRLKSYEREVLLVGEEAQDIDTQRVKVEEQKVSLEEVLNKLGEQEQTIHHDQEVRHKDIQSVEEKRGGLLKNVAEHQTRFQHLEERYSMLEEAIELLTENDAHDRDRIEQLAKESTRIQEQTLETDKADEELKTSLEALGRNSQEVEISLGIIRKEKESIEGQIAEKQQEIESVSAEQQELSNELHQLEMNQMDLNYREKSISERLQQTYQLNLKDYQPEEYRIQEEELVDIEQTLEKLQSRVQSLGTVNLLAIEEYDELKTRYDFLMTQKQDMEEARSSLLEAIRKINRTTKGLFERTFESVHNAFREYYQTLFQGGEAKLVLIDEAHPLESGIEIVCRPPGKKLQTMGLLSGGEKAMTAIALLFALFKIKPSPFCVLDEVDAPLDEANIDRFLAVVKTFLKSSQFIIVTHNRKTIAMGDSLYGVTMQEAGVSKIVSVKVNQDDVVTDTTEAESSREDLDESKPSEDKTKLEEDTVTS